MKNIAERGFDPRTSGLWAQHASTAPLCWCDQYIDVVQHRLQNGLKNLTKKGFKWESYVNINCYNSKDFYCKSVYLVSNRLQYGEKSWTKTVLKWAFILVIYGKNNLWIKLCIIKNHSRARFRSSDLWVMGPARFHCTTLLVYWLSTGNHFILLIQANNSNKVIENTFNACFCGRIG